MPIEEAQAGDAVPPLPGAASPGSMFMRGGVSRRRLSDRADEAAPLLERGASLLRTFSSVKREVAPPPSPRGPRTLSRMLASRLCDLGVTHFFGVPGDFNLALLDEFLLEPRLKMISCCNELNAGYAADGYARAKGVGAVVATFAVGGLSLINALAGAYAEDQAVVCIVGAPYTAAFASTRVVHHTLGEPGNLEFESACLKPVTCHQAVLRGCDTPSSMLAKIDAALQACLTHRKPVYISIPSDLATLRHAAFATAYVPPPLPASVSSQLEAAVAAVAAFLNNAQKPVLVAGAHMRSARARAALLALAEASGFPVAVMLNSKGLFPEDHPNFIGLFWSSLSSPVCGETVVASDAYLMAGPVMHDIGTAGFTAMLDREALVDVGRNSVRLGAAGYYGHVQMEDFLEALAPKLKRNTTALEKFKRQYIPPGVPPTLPAGSPLTVSRWYKHLQTVLAPTHALVCDVGDSMFWASKLRLPGGMTFEIQSLYASIGWSLPAMLGYSLGAPARRAVCIIGDGALHMSVQELATVLRYGTNPIVIVSANAAYTVEAEIHDGPYNELLVWDFCKLAEAFDNGRGAVRTFKVSTEEEAAAAMAEAMGITDKAVLIECITDPSDCSVELLTLGRLMKNSNAGSGH